MAGGVPTKALPVFELGTPVVFTGYPSYLQGLKGKVTYLSDQGSDMLRVTFDKNGSWILTDRWQIERIDYDNKTSKTKP